MGACPLCASKSRFKIQPPSNRGAVSFSIDWCPPRRPTPLGAPAEAAETRGGSPIGSARVRVHELFSGDLGSNAIGHAVSVGGQVVDRPAGRSETPGSRGQHDRPGPEGHQSLGVHRDPYPTHDPAAADEQLSDHSAIDDGSSSLQHLPPQYHGGLPHGHHHRFAGADGHPSPWRLLVRPGGAVRAELHAPGE